MGHTGTEKKNPFVMTIGFDQNDPEHVEVADFLNSLSRKKAQYIVEAVRCYWQIYKDGKEAVKVVSAPVSESVSEAMTDGLTPYNLDTILDYAKIRNMVFQIMDEHEQSINGEKVIYREVLKQNVGHQDDLAEEMDNNAIENIFDAIRTFRE